MINEFVLLNELEIFQFILLLFAATILISVTIVILLRKIRRKNLKHFAHKHNFQIVKGKSRESALPFDLFKQGEEISFKKVLQRSLNGRHIEFCDYEFSKGENKAAVFYQYSVALLNVDSKTPDFSLLKNSNIITI